MIEYITVKDTFPNFERLLKNLYHELDLSIVKETERNLK